MLRDCLKLGKTLVMGVLNVTPDSFSDGGKYLGLEAAEGRVSEMIEEGVDIIDIGGESSGPGSVDVSLENELGRVLPVVEGVLSELRRREKGEGQVEDGGKRIFVSVDTWKSEVARRCLEMGVDIINDVTGLRGDEEMAGVVAEFCEKRRLAGGEGPFVVIMYSKDDTARTSREVREYGDVVGEIKAFFEERVEYAVGAGVPRENIILDPGMGAFVSMEAKYSYEILERLKEFEELGLPILIGASRKSFLGGAVDERLEKGLECAVTAVRNGARIIRTHDVGETISAFCKEGGR